MMKRSVFAVALLAAVTASAAEVVSSNVLGCLPVTSANKRTIVAVPWCSMSATDDAAIQVSNLVKTANLTAGDMLHYVNSNGSYLSWRLSNTAVKYWESVVQASEGGFETSPSAHNQTVARGSSIVLIRQNFTNELGQANTFYLYGQLGTSSTEVKTTVAQGTSENPAYSLIASPSVGDWNVNGITWSNVDTNDMISIILPTGMQKLLTPRETKDPAGFSWGSMNPLYNEKKHSMTGSVWTVYSTAIPAGQGAWYISKGGNPTISWSGVPTK